MKKINNDFETTGDGLIDPEENGETPSSTARHAGTPGGDAMIQGLPPVSTSSSAGLSHLSAASDSGVIDSDYGFGSSWPTIPLPLSPEDVAARVMAADSNVRGGGELEEHQRGDCFKDGNSSSSAQTAHSHKAAGQEGGVGSALQLSPHRSSLYHRDSLAAVVAEENSNNSSSSSGNGPFGIGTPTAAAGGAVERDGGEGGERGAHEGIAEEGRGPGGACGAGAPMEQVSLPEDIYGAARVSEYWHGMHALSSLASAYVYDDIWAGDGGLNPR